MAPTDTPEPAWQPLAAVMMEMGGLPDHPPETLAAEARRLASRSAATLNQLADATVFHLAHTLHPGHPRLRTHAEVAHLTGLRTVGQVRAAIRRHRDTLHDGDRHA